MKAFTSSIMSAVMAAAPATPTEETEIPDGVREIAKTEAWAHGGVLERVIHHADGSFSMVIRRGNQAETVPLGCCPPRKPVRINQRNDRFRRDDDDLELEEEDDIAP